MTKQGSMDMFLKRRNKNTNDESQINSNSSKSDNEVTNESEEPLLSKRLRTSFTRK